MRIFTTLAFLLIYYLGLFSQCINENINNTFNFECTAGSSNGARIGIDSVVHIGTGWGEITIGNASFQIFKNGLLMINGVAEYDIGDIIKIKPNSVGATSFSVLSDEPGCQISRGYDKLACLQTLPIYFETQPTAKLQKNQTQITWVIASQINNDKYIIEHSYPDSYREALNFSPIGEIPGDGTNNETKHYEYIHTSPSIGINYRRIHPVG